MQISRTESLISGTNGQGINAAPSEAETLARLVALLTAYAGNAIPFIQDRGQPQLRQVPFATVIAAVERARPVATTAAEIRLYQEWIKENAGHSPHLFAAWFNLGAAFSKAGDHANAVTAFSSALALKPDLHSAAVNLGLSLETLGQADAALATWERAIQPDDARVTLFSQRARLLESLGRLDEAEKTLRALLLTDPGHLDALSHWVHIRQKLCRWPVLANDIPGIAPDDMLRDCGSLSILALTDDVTAQARAARSWVDRKTQAAPQRLSPAEGYRHDRLRIGYLSSDFCRHAMSFLITELFERHDRSRFEIFGYCASPEDGSDVRRRVLGAFDHHRVIRSLSDEQAARLIRGDEIDILVDLNGLTSGTRLPILRWRPAPVQATYLGFVGPVPLPELDYLFCDDYVIPPRDAALYHPTPLPIARIYQANDSKRVIQSTLTRRDAGLPEDRFVFCCFSNHYKITEAMFAAWVTALRAAPHAVLWLTADHASSQANMRAAAERAGVAPERLLFAGRTDPDTYMARLGLADLFLDTFPYNAGTIASDAIRMQLPLVTLAGQSFASRMAGRMLDAIGAPEGIAGDLDEYAAIAAGLANDPGRYAAYRSRFTGQTWADTLGDIATFCRQYEATLGKIAKTAKTVS